MMIHNLDPVLVDLGFFQIRWYSIAYIVGILFGWIYAIKIIKNTNNTSTINQTNFEELLIYLILGIIFGGRLGYVMFYNLIRLVFLLRLKNPLLDYEQASRIFLKNYEPH